MMLTMLGGVSAALIRRQTTLKILLRTQYVTPYGVETLHEGKTEPRMSE